MRTIIPFLWFEDRAEEAAQYYVSILKIRGSAPSPGTGKRERKRPEGRKER